MVGLEEEGGLVEQEHVLMVVLMMTGVGEVVLDISEILWMVLQYNTA